MKGNTDEMEKQSGRTQLGKMIFAEGKENLKQMQDMA